MKRIFPLIIILVSVLSLNSCGKLKGQFAYKAGEMDAYRQMTDDMEFASDAPVEWVFAFERVSGKRMIYVVVQKKEIVWVDVLKDVRETEKASPYVHGRIESLVPGEYRIVLAEKETLIAEKPFVVYDPSDTEDAE